MRPKLAIALVLTVMSTSSCALFGKPDYCTQSRQGNFKSFLDDDWRAYCAEFEEKTTAVGNYTLEELTAFYGAHPQRVQDLKDEMVRFEDVNACFTEPREELELRSLNSCLSNDEAQQLEVNNAWKARAKPWLESIQLTIQGNRPKISELESESRRLQRKAEEAFNFNAQMEPGGFEKFRAELSALESDLAGATNAQRSFQKMQQLAGGNASLTAAIQADYGPAFAELAREIQDQREDVEALKVAERYLEFAVNSAGKRCPKGIKARSEKRAAQKALESQVASIGRRTRDIQISSVTELEERGPVQYERFEGYVCGKRSSENQFDGKPQQCGVYRFMLERTKGFDDKKWEPWLVKGWQESGPDGGVDCGLL
jgi:hypothetical protein